MFPGFDMSKMQQMLDELSASAEGFAQQMREQRFAGSAGAGMVRVELNGEFEVMDLHIDSEALEDKTALQVMLSAAFNEASRAAREQLAGAGMAQIFKGARP